MVYLGVMVVFMVLNLYSFTSPKGEFLEHASIKKLSLLNYLLMKRDYYAKGIFITLGVSIMGVMIGGESIVGMILAFLGVQVAGVLIDYIVTLNEGITLHQYGIRYGNIVHDYYVVAGAVVENDLLGIMVYGRTDYMELKGDSYKFADAINGMIQRNMKKSDEI